MAWSTRQLADLAGVTLRSIRHWHDIGLLPEPERLPNGYKQYTGRHLILALRISRLTSLGFTLDDVARMLDSEERGQESLHGLRTELDTRIAGLERIRAEVDELIRLGVSPDLSPDALLAMEALGRDFTSRNVAIVLTHLMPGEDTIRFVNILKEAPDEFLHINTAFLELSAEAPEDEIAALADRAASTLKGFFDAHQDALPGIDNSRAGQLNADVLNAVVAENLNRAQRRVMHLIIDHLTNGPERR